jgi:nucleoside-diphosphate-sugar epimerase
MLVTGAGGFVGGRVVEMTHLAGFAKVRAGLRRWNTAARVARFGVDMQLCDVLKPEQLATNMTGMNVVVHCAFGDRDVIVKGTENVLDAAYKNGVKRFVHISTAEIYGNVSGDVDETFPYSSMNSSYADAKIEAEQLCWEYAKKGLGVTVLRPSIVYGPFGNLFLVKIAERLYTGALGDMKDTADGICNLIYIDDLVRCIFLSIINERAVGQAFNVNGPDKVTWNDYFVQLGRALNISKLNDLNRKETKAKSTALSLIKPAATYLGKHYGESILRMGRRLGVEGRVERIRSFLNTTPSMFELGLYSRKAYYSYKKAATILGYSPRYDLLTGTGLSVQWLLHEGYLQRFGVDSELEQDTVNLQ